jgi:hypothetical protein
MDETMDNPFAGLDEGETVYDVKPLTAKQRLIIQNLFDSNTVARKKYLKQLGYEMSDSDDNLIRPLGSKMDYIEIDPGFSDALKKGGLEALGKEILQDAGDIGYDMTDLGTKVIGTIVGAAGGGGVASIGTAMAGAAAAGALSNTVKQQLRDVFLDEDLDFDTTEMLVDSALSAVGTGVIKGGVKGARLIKDWDLSTRINGIKNALKAAGNVPDPGLIEYAAKNPDMFTEEAVKGGATRLADAHKAIFGLDTNEFIKDAKTLRKARPDSYFGKLIAPVMDAQDQAIKALSTDTRANVSYPEAKSQLQSLYESLETRVLRRNPSDNEKKAFEVVKEQINNLKKMAEDKVFSPLKGTELSAKTNPKISDYALKDVTFNFGEAREFLDGLQDTVFNKETKITNTILGEAAHGVRVFLDNVAQRSGNEIGQELPKLNNRISGMIDDFDIAKEKMNVPNLVRAYVGGAKTPEGRIQANEIQQFIANMDQKYQTQLAQDFEPKTAAAVFEGLYQGAPAKGSSNINAFMVQEFGKGFAQGAGTGGLIGSAFSGIGTVPGVLTGGTVQGLRKATQAATLSRPEQGLRALGPLLQEQAGRSSEDELSIVIRNALDSAKGGIGGAAASQAAPNFYQGTETEDDNPFAGID